MKKKETNMKPNTNIFIMMSLIVVVCGQLESSEGFKKMESPEAAQSALEQLKKLKTLVIRSAGLTLTILRALETIGDIKTVAQFLAEKVKEALRLEQPGGLAQALKEVETIEVEQQIKEAIEEEQQIKEVRKTEEVEEELILAVADLTIEEAQEIIKRAVEIVNELEKMEVNKKEAAFKVVKLLIKDRRRKIEKLEAIKLIR